MSWQTIVKENNLDISVVKLSDIEGLLRIEAEFYNLPFLNRRKILLNKRTQKLNDIAKLTSGPAYSSDAISDISDENSIPIVRIGDITNKRPIENLSYLSMKEFEKFGSQKASRLDILMTMTGDPPDVGKCNMWQIGDDQDLAFNQRVCKISARKGMSAFVLFAYLSTEYSRSFAERYAMGIRQRNVSIKDIKNIPIAYFPTQLTEVLERGIKNHFNLLESSKEKYKDAEQLLLKEINLSEYKPNEESISVRLFSESLADNRFDAEYWQPDFDDIQNAIKKNKDGFDKLDKLFELSDKKVRIDPEKEYLYAELADVNSASGTIDNFTTLQGKELPSRGRMALKKNDIIVSSVEGSLEKIALVLSEEKNIIGSTGFFVLRQKAYEPEVALVLLKSKPIQQLLKRQAQGTILTAIPKTSLPRVLLPKISQSVQGQIKQKIAQSNKERQEAKNLLEKAKRAVEIFIEQDEKQALAYLNQ